MADLIVLNATGKLRMVYEEKSLNTTTDPAQMMIKRRG